MMDRRMLTTVLSFIGILLVLVLVHELGHFLVAKFLGVKVEEFGFGFPPRVWGKKIGETIYSLNWLPIGGFVKLFGEDEAGGGSVKISNMQHPLSNIEKKRAFFTRPVWQRASIVFAGVAMNFLLATGILTGLVVSTGVSSRDKIVISDVAHNSPAAEAKVVVGDEILSLDNQKVENYQTLLSYITSHKGKPIHLVVRTPQHTIQEITLTPRVTYPANQGPMGVALMQRVAWYKAPLVGLQQALLETWLILQGLGLAVAQLFVGKIPQGVAGPVGIAQLTGQAIGMGPYMVLSFLALLSLNLAILNVLPLPALDGGRLFFILWEGLTGKKVNPKVEGYIHAAGMAFLLTLMVIVTLHDVFQILSGKPVIPQ